MKISILCFNLSGNSLGRAFLLADILEMNHTVEIIGPKFSDKIWPPVSGERNYVSVESSPLIHRFPLDASKLLAEIDGDVIIASKQRTSSYGLGLIKKGLTGIPLILDIDDWESGFYFSQSSHPYLKNLPYLASCNSFYYTRFLENLSGFADEVTVSNTFLKSKFGGELVPHVRDTEQFSPQKFDKIRSRQQLGIPEEEKIVMFSGSPAPHKGVEDLIEAFPLTGASNCRLYLVGVGDSEYENYIKEIAGISIEIVGQKPWHQIPHWITAADIITVPQRSSDISKGQLPAKLFDAMALGKTILATDVGDIPLVIGDAGVIVEPGSPDAIRRELTNLMDDDEYRSLLGTRARQRCVAEYSYKKYRPILDKIVQDVI